MNMFKLPEAGGEPPRSAPLIRPAIVVLVVALLTGVGLVVWRAVNRLEDHRYEARVEVQARAALMETQLQQALSAADILAVHGRQAVGGGIPGFAGVAAGLLATRPALAAIELQPSGVVRDVVPRNGNEHMLELNVRTDPRQAAGVAATIQRRQTTVCGPVDMRGGKGLVVRVPLFERARNGVESFWGLVAVSVRFQDVAEWARLDDVRRRGYKYALLPALAETRGYKALVGTDGLRLGSAVQQSIRVGSLEFRLALEPVGGWFDVWRAGAELLLALFVAGLLCAVVNLFQSLRGLDADLLQMQEQLRQVTRAEGLAQQEARASKDAQAKLEAELELANTNLKEASAHHRETQLLTEQAFLKARQDGAALREDLARSQKASAELQLRLETALRESQKAVSAREAGEKASAAVLAAALEQVRETTELLDEAVRAGKESEALRAKEFARMAREMKDLGTLLEAAQKAEAAGAAVQAQQAVTAKLTTGELEARQRELESYRRQVSELATELSASKRDFEEALATIALREGELAARSAMAVATPVPEEAPAQAIEELVVLNEPPAADESSDEITDRIQEVAPVPEDQAGPVTESKVEPEPATEAVVESVEEEDGPVVLVGEESVAQITGAATEPVAVVAAELEPAAVLKPARRKKVRRDDQMDLFGAPVVAPEPERDAVLEAGTPLGSESVIEPPPPLKETVVESVESEPAATDPGIEPEEVTEEVQIETPVEEAANPAVAEEDAAEPVDMPVVEGLVTADGLAWADGDPVLYLQKLAQFVEHQAGSAIKVRNALERGEFDEAGRVVRSLKTESGEIGAVAANGAAATLERAIHDHYEPGDIEAIWAEMEGVLGALIMDLKAALNLREEKPSGGRAMQGAAVDLPTLRKAVAIIVPLLVDGDPGAKDCWKDNKATFRSAFPHDGHVEFERCIKSGEFHAAMDALKKALKKHGVSI